MVGGLRAVDLYEPPLNVQRVSLGTKVTVEYLEQGPADAPALVLLHGFPDSVSSFDRLRPLLSPALHIYTVGLRGFGDSDQPHARSAYSIEQWAADVRSFFEAKAIRRAAVAGHAMGGIVAHAFASYWPRLVTKLLLIDACATARHNAVLGATRREISAEGFELSAEYVSAFQTSTIYNRSSLPDRFVQRSIVARSRQAPLRVWRASLQAMEDYAPSAEVLGRITAPARLLYGEHDTLFSREACAAPLAASLRSAELVELVAVPAAGRSPIWDAPQRVASSINDFLRPANQSRWPRPPPAGLEAWSWPVACAARGQRLFDAGMRLVLTFDFAAASPAFQLCGREEPTCGMCMWGEALSLGQTLNAPAVAAWEARARSLALRALELTTGGRSAAAGASSSRAQLRDSMLARALVARHASASGGGVSNDAYAAAMAEAAERFGDDATVLMLAADAHMNRAPWDYWAAGGTALRPAAASAKVLLDGCLRIEPEHPGCLHLLIHLLEAGPLGRAAAEAAPLGKVAAAEAAEALRAASAAADALRRLVPGSPHLEHMPSHIDMLTASYSQGVLANQRAAALPLAHQIYPLHNLESLLWCARMAGQRDVASRAAEQLAELAAVLVLASVPEAGFNIERFAAQRLLTHVYHREWKALADAKPPPARFLFWTAIWRFGRGLAAVHGVDAPLGDAGDAADAAAAASGDDDDLAALEVLLSRLASHGSTYGSLVDAATVYTHLLRAARLASADAATAARADETASSHLDQAVAIEARLPYDEPPLLLAPVRPQLAALLEPEDKAEVKAEAPLAHRLVDEGGRARRGEARSSLAAAAALLGAVAAAALASGRARELLLVGRQRRRLLL